MSEIPHPGQPEQHEQQTPRFGVAEMDHAELSGLVARLEAETITENKADHAYWKLEEEAKRLGVELPPRPDAYDPVEPFNLLTTEMNEVIKHNPDKGWELSVAMAESSDPFDRRMIAHNMPALLKLERANVVSYSYSDEKGREAFSRREDDRREAGYLIAKLLTDRDGDVQEAMELTLDAAAADRRLIANDLLWVTSGLVALVDQARNPE